MNRYFGLHTLEGEWHSLLPRYLLLSERVAGRRILDIGCGSGLGASLLLEMGAERVDAVDHRPAVLEVARMKHAKQGLDFQVMFWEELNFADDTFDMVLCLDPTSPVTDPNLLLEMRRVLKPGGEYVCAIERRNRFGFEKVLPRYGYADAAESIDVHQRGERVPQLGALGGFFETIVSVVQRPQYSFLFDLNTDPSSHQPAPSEMRKVAGGLVDGTWRDGNQEGDQPRWIGIDRGLSLHDADEGSVEILFCGDSHLPPAPTREIRMPYYGLVERLDSLINGLQERSHVRDDRSPFGDVVEDDAQPVFHDFSERETTGQFRVIDEWDDLQETQVANRTGHQPAPYAGPHTGDEASRLELIQQQLDHMSWLYGQVRDDMAAIAQSTRAEIAGRDRYIDQLVALVHMRDNQLHDAPAAAPATNDFLDEPNTGVFSKTLVEELAEANRAEQSGADVDAPAAGEFAAQDDEGADMGVDGYVDAPGHTPHAPGVDHAATDGDLEPKAVREAAPRVDADVDVAPDAHADDDDATSDTEKEEQPV